MAYEWFIAGRYLRSQQRSGFISIIAYMAAAGVVLGVAALTIMLSVSNGFTSEVKKRLIGMNAHVSVQKFHGTPIDDYEALGAQLRDFPGVVAAAPIIDSKVVITAKDQTGGLDGIFLWGVEPRSFPGVSDLPEHLLYDRGHHLRLGAMPGQKFPGIILGEYLANRLQVGLGDTVLLMTVKNMPLEDFMAGVTPRMRQFLVTDLFASGMYQYDDGFAFIALEDAQRLFDMAGEATHVYLRLAEVDRAVQVRQAIDESLGYPYKVVDWTQLNPELFRWMELEKWVIFIALSLIIVVAAFNIMSILIMSIMIKTPEIGILRAMGSTTQGIRRIFLYQGMTIGVVGTALGCLSGFVVCSLQAHFELISIPADVYIISSLPVDMQVMDFLLVSLVSIGVCMLASVYPARKAAQLMPVDAIRYIM